MIDSSDVLIQVLDVRDPVGTRSTHIEKYIKKEKSHKHMIIVLNKVLPPTTYMDLFGVCHQTRRWAALCHVIRSNSYNFIYY